MEHPGTIQLSREIEAIQIPSGQKLILPVGTAVVITQALGGTYTVVVQHQAGLYRILGQDSDALGLEKVNSSTQIDKNAAFDENKAWNQLKTVYDPEIPVNIVDLGLIYSLDAQPHPEGGMRVDVKMTLTAPGCGMGPSIAADARQKLLNVPGVKEANVELVWEPPWTAERISPEGKERLGIA